MGPPGRRFSANVGGRHGFSGTKPLLDAVKKRLEQGVFGYPASPKEAEEAVVGHYKRRYQVMVQPE